MKLFKICGTAKTLMKIAYHLCIIRNQKSKRKGGVKNKNKNKKIILYYKAIPLAFIFFFNYMLNTY